MCKKYLSGYGWIIIGYSQGGLIVRGMLETYGDKHNVKTFVSLSSPQGGQFGGKYVIFIVHYSA